MRSSVNFRFVLVCSLSLIFQLFTPTNRLAAQERKGNISGHVTDNSGGVLQGAEIEKKCEPSFEWPGRVLY
jgi:hypothetical protein